MKKILLAAAALVACSATANAAVITLHGITGPANNYTFTYQGTLGPDEGVRPGDNLIIYDFAGYIPGSIFSTSSNLTTTTALLNPGPLIPGQIDSPTLTNLIFTYNGPAFHNAGGPFVPLDFTGIGARSTFNNTILKAFTSLTTKNNPAGAANTPVVTLGLDLAPTASVPEPAMWGMMIVGFGLVGASTRRRNRTIVAA